MSSNKILGIPVIEQDFDLEDGEIVLGYLDDYVSHIKYPELYDGIDLPGRMCRCVLIPVNGGDDGMTAHLCKEHYDSVCRVLGVDEIELFPLAISLPCILCGDNSEYVTSKVVMLEYTEKLFLNGDPDPNKRVVGILGSDEAATA